MVIMSHVFDIFSLSSLLSDRSTSSFGFEMHIKDISRNPEVISYSNAQNAYATLCLGIRLYPRRG